MENRWNKKKNEKGSNVSSFGNIYFCGGSVLNVGDVWSTHNQV